METRYEGGIVDEAEGLNNRPWRFIACWADGLASVTDSVKKLSSVFDTSQAPEQPGRTGGFFLNNYAVEIRLRF